LTYEGFEPELFKQTFKNDWKPFAKPTEEISEEGSDDSKDSDLNKKELKLNQSSIDEVISHLPAKYWLN
jgi:hypothetical protein